MILSKRFSKKIAKIAFLDTKTTISSKIFGRFLEFLGVFVIVCPSWFNFVAFLPSSSVSDFQNSPGATIISYNIVYRIFRENLTSI